MPPASISSVRFSASLGVALAFALLTPAAAPGRVPDKPTGNLPGADLFGKSLEAAVQAVRVYGSWD